MRTRTTIGATLVIGVALLIGSMIFVRLLHGSLVDGVDESLRLRAETVASLVQRGTATQPLPQTGDETSFVQVIGADGTVLASSANIEGEGPLVPLQPKPNGITIRTVSQLPIGNGNDFRLLTQVAPTPTGSVTVYVAGTVAEADRSVAAVTRGLVVGDPVFLLIVAAMTWLVVGRALSPVEAIRTEVARVSALALDRRVPEPAVTDEIGRLARTMNEMLDRLQSSDRRQRQFVADASHELRGPLAALRTQLEVALAHPSPTEWQAAVGDALHDLARLQRLVDQLLVLARSGAAAAATATAIDLDDVVLREIGRLRETTELVVDVHDVSAARVRGDLDQLAQVVRNLLDNASRHAHERVTVGVRLQDSSAVLIVTDDGAGIAPQDRQRIFERFTRLDAARAADDGGSGLGLAITHSIVTAHGGTISVEDSPGGARFVVRLPATPP